MSARDYLPFEEWKGEAMAVNSGWSNLGRVWTQDEDDLLQEVMACLPNATWQERSELFEGRTADALMRRWRRIKDETGHEHARVDEGDGEDATVKETRYSWLPREDSALTSAHALFPDDWDAVASWVSQEAPHPDGHFREPKACQSRLAKLLSDAPTESSGRKWSPNDIQLVRKHYPTYGPDLALLFDGRSREAVGNIAFREGVVNEDRSRSPKTGRYSGEEEALLRDFDSRPIDDLAKVMRRSTESVRAKLRSMQCPISTGIHSRKADILFSLGDNGYPVAKWDSDAQDYILLFGKHKGEVLHDVAWGYLRWINTRTDWLPEELITAANEVMQSRKQQRAEAVDTNTTDTKRDDPPSTNGWLARIADWFYRYTHNEEAVK